MNPPATARQAALEPPLPELLLSGRWRRRLLLGQGRLGEVYEVEEVASGRVAALKLFRGRFLPEAWRGLEQTARLAEQLPLEACPRVLEFGYEPLLKRRYHLSERINLPSLQELVFARGPLDRKLTSELLRRLAAPLEVAHASGLVHRNIKPTNIFFDPDCLALKISDFGTCWLQTSTPAVPGWGMTPGWAAPEGVDPKAPSAVSMDGFAVGLLAFFALTGENPYGAETSADLARLRDELYLPFGQASERAKLLGATLSPELDAWFERALAPEPGARFAGITEQAEAFAAQESSVRRLSAPPPPSQAGPVSTRPRPRSIPPAVLLPEQKYALDHGVGDLESLVSSASAQPIALLPSLPPKPRPLPEARDSTHDRMPSLSTPKPPMSAPAVSAAIHSTAAVSAPIVSGPLLPAPAHSPGESRAVERALLYAVSTACGVSASGLALVIALLWKAPVFAAVTPVATTATVAALPAATVAPAAALPALPAAAVAADQAAPVIAVTEAPKDPPRDEGPPAESADKPTSAGAGESEPPVPQPEQTGQRPEAADGDAELTKATVHIRCSPGGCDSIYCNAVPRKLGEPVLLPPGKHTCKAMKAGFRSVSQTFRVQAGDVLEQVYVQRPRQ